MSKQTIGEFLATQRKAKGYTQQYVADMLGISNRTLSAWETNKAYPDILTLPALAELYGVTADEIIKGERNTNVVINSNELSEKSQTKLLKSKLAKNSSRCITLLILGICADVAYILGLVLMGLAFWLAIILAVAGLFTAIAVIVLISYNMKGVQESFSLSEQPAEADKKYIVSSVKQYVKTANIICGVWLACGAILSAPAFLALWEWYSVYLVIMGASALIVVALLIAVNCYKAKIVKKYTAPQTSAQEQDIQPEVGCEAQPDDQTAQN